MAKGHSGGPGVSTRGGVVTTMDNVMGASSSPGSGNKMKAPFDAQSVGSGAIPTTVYAKGIQAPKVPKPTGGPIGVNNGPGRRK